MAKQITNETVQFVVESLKKHGFEHALNRASVDCIKEGMDADDFTYSVVSLFVTFILQRSMASHSDVDRKFDTLRGNTTAVFTIVRSVAEQLAKQLDAERAEEENSAKESGTPPALVKSH